VTPTKRGAMNLGLRTILLALAAVLFLLGVFSDVHQGDFVCWGLLATVAAFIVDDLGLGRNMNMGGAGTRREP
jgi:uncharacterized membrane protein YccC